MLVGSHVSIRGGLLGAAQEAFSYGATTFMTYTGAPQNTVRKELSSMKIEEGKEFMSAHGISEFVVHAPYIINLASWKEETWNLAVEFLAKEIQRTQAVGGKYLVLHPGAYTGRDLEYGINRIAQGLNQILDENTKPMICLETMAGKGTEVGRTFEELQAIIEKVHLEEKIGVCFDTCHTHDSGYDLIHDLDGVFQQFDQTIGLERLKVFHINGSLNPCGARKDRHANLGAEKNNPKGKDYIGKSVFSALVKHPASFGRPLILETPWLDNKTNLYQEEIEFLKSAAR
ncbi:MAG: deoxyribonuclease IV [Clostridiales bacterium]|nr:deoxyribonuclease IV [Clostridiales bacterium]